MTEPDEQAASQCPLQAKSYLVQDETDENGERVYHARIPEGLYLELIAAWKACAAPANEAYRLVFEALQLTPGSSKQDVARIRNALTLLPALKLLPEQNLNPFSSLSQQVKEAAVVPIGAEMPEVVEGISRAMCFAEGVDPDATGYAITESTLARLGEAFPLWKYRIPVVAAIISALPPQRDDRGLVKELASALEGLVRNLGPNGYIPSAGKPATDTARAILAKVAAAKVGA